MNKEVISLTNEESSAELKSILIFNNRSLHSMFVSKGPSKVYGEQSLTLRFI